MDLHDALFTQTENIFSPAPLKVKFQTGDLIFENKQKATFSKSLPFFWPALSCGAIDSIALLLLYRLALLLLLIFWLLFSVFSTLECMMEGGEASVVYADRTFATSVAATF
ncbi:hypothetical protein IFT37_20220 [Pseudomonas fluorescens]|uniref:hypothetical protein n=2 Tax=Pseudomonas fluorescens TaxID=294 RepID=UPI00177B4B93|nr:hypothetical protein [Pseudomonas fluorescens]MBD8148236.1 hypothetical protein [Pseudomonas fluorescens]MBD8178157.1 hypothetical protein [Pseudomonas fluorescens]MBD8747432.1 hypothetical protein [Pseudomonas fluorescens]MBD8760927.1 hypothetical protein [Pseudomonas fluorescens]MBD8765698.1 hypothetical protein [Pseudomonas fluorescens]